MGIQLDLDRAAGKRMVLNFDFPDTEQRYALFVERSVLNAWPDHQDANADARVTLDRATLNRVLAKELTLNDGIEAGKVEVACDAGKLAEIIGSLDDLGKSFWFDIVTP